MPKQKPKAPVKKTKKDGTARRVRVDGLPDQRGGFMPGGGRPKGSLTKRQSYTIDYYRSRYPVQPLDHFMSILNGEPYEEKVVKIVNGEEKVVKTVIKTPSKIDRMEAAKAAAPFLHQRLSAVQVTAEGGQLQHKIDVTKLSDEELAALESICVKALIPVEEPSYAPQENDISVEYSVLKNE